jgi:cytochrome c-type biogenesis protein
MSDISITFSFLAGMISFFSPCVLPIVPGFLTYLAGVNIHEAKQKQKQIFVQSIFFVLGFSFVFALLGVLLNSVFAHVSYQMTAWLSWVGGVVIIFFGLTMTGLVSVPYLSIDHKFSVRKKFASRSLTSFVFGAAFAVGWTPCVGAVLGGIIALAVADPSKAFLYFLVYAVGLGVPFLITGLFVGPATLLFQKLGSSVEYMNIVFGMLMIVIGILVTTQTLSVLANLSIINQLLLH